MHESTHGQFVRMPITGSPGHQFTDMVCGVRKYHRIKSTVDDIAQSAGCDQCDAYNETGRRFGIYQQTRVPDKTHYHQNAEKAE